MMEHAEMEGGEFCIKVEEASPIPSEVAKVADVRAKLRALGPRPDAVEVEEARKAIVNIEACLKDQLANISAAPCPPGEDIENWSADQVGFVYFLLLFLFLFGVRIVCSPIKRTANSMDNFELGVGLEIVSIG